MSHLPRMTPSKKKSLKPNGLEDKFHLKSTYAMEVSTPPSQRSKRPSLAIHSPFCSQINSVTSPGKNSWHGDLITPTRIQALDLALDTEDIPSKTPCMNPTRMPTNFLPSRKASRGKCHNTQCSKMRSILKPLKESFWSQPQHMTVKRSWMEITKLKIMMILKNSLSRRNT